MICQLYSSFDCEVRGSAVADIKETQICRLNSDIVIICTESHKLRAETACGDLILFEKMIIAHIEL